MAGYPGVPHIPDRRKGEQKDFSTIIALAKTCPPPKELESGELVGGFAHNQVIALADQIVDAVKNAAKNTAYMNKLYLRVRNAKGFLGYKYLHVIAKN